MKNKRIMIEGLTYAGMLFAVCIAWLIVQGFGLQGKTGMIQIAMAILLAGGLITLLVLWRRKKLTAEIGIAVLIYMGCVMRIGYMLYTPFEVRSHDLFENTVDSDGKSGYLLRLMLEHRLPESNELQLYQQPLFYLLGAFFSKVLNTILGNHDVFGLLDAAKTVSCVASCWTMLIARKLFATLEISPKSTVYGMMLLSFTPVFYLTGGRLGENALALLLIVAAVLYTLYWDKNPNWKHTLLLAFLYGFGMMTKSSVAVPALFTLVIFIRNIHKNKLWSKENLRLYLKIIVFGIISFPLGLWFSVRNKVLFGQGLTYVLEQNKESSLYCGAISLMQRFLIPDLQNLVDTPSASPWTDHNLPVYLLKTELFGEFTYEVWAVLPVLLLFLNLLIALAVLKYLGKLLYQCYCKKAAKTEWLLLGGMLLFVGFAAYSYLRYPFGCTMDFRYYMPITVCKALIIGHMFDGEKGALVRITGKICVLFCFLSCVMYCLI